MQNDVLMDDRDNEEKDTRILNDDEYARVLKSRNDIFFIEKNRRLRIIGSMSLAIGIVLGAWLSTKQADKVESGFYQNIMKERSARLLRGLGPLLPREAEPQQLADRTQPREEWELRISRHSQSRNISAADLGKMQTKNLAGLSHVKTARQESPAVVPNGLANVRPDNADKAEDKTSFLNTGNANKTNGNRADAFSAFRRVLKQDPHNTTALTGMGDLFLYTGVLDSATAFYTAANAENPRVASVHNGLGSTRYYLSVMAANPNFVRLNRIKDPARYIQSQYDSAIAEYTNAFSLDSLRVDALTNRGVIRDMRGDHATAMEDYTRAIKIKPAYAEAYTKRAATYKALGKLKESLADYTSAIRLDTGSYEFDPALHFANAYFGRGNVEFQLGNYAMAMADFDSTLAHSPNHSIAMLNKARALVNEKQYDSGIVWYTRAISMLSPTEYGGAQERGYFGRGVAYNLTDRPALAIQDFNAAIKLKPDDPYSYFYRGNAFKALARFDEAIADYKTAKEFPALAAKACWRIAECYALKQDKANALVWLKNSISNGFANFRVWERDKDLSLLWNDKEFRDLTK
jgi:tetratricopeptide (TPR) repeat protein